MLCSPDRRVDDCHLVRSDSTSPIPRTVHAIDWGTNRLSGPRRGHTDHNNDVLLHTDLNYAPLTEVTVTANTPFGCVLKLSPEAKEYSHRLGYAPWEKESLRWLTKADMANTNDNMLERVGSPEWMGMDMVSLGVRQFRAIANTWARTEQKDVWEVLEIQDMNHIR